MNVGSAGNTSSFFAVPTLGIRPADLFFGPSELEQTATGLRFAGSAVPAPVAAAILGIGGLLATRCRW